MPFYDAIRIGASGAADFEIERSLRFNDNDSAYLRYTPSSTSSDRKTWTWSSWVKRGNLSLGAQATIFHSYGSGNQRTELTFETSDTIRFAQGAASSGGSLITTAKFRDVSAWYHIMCVADCSNTTAADRLKIYVNGVIQTDFGTQNNAADSNTQMPTQGVHIDIGSRGGSNRHFDGYMAEINFIDGQALTPSSFAETDAETGQYNPKKYVGSYGTNGFYLNFSDNSDTSSTTLGKDSSGNGNNFTPNNFSVSAGAGNDSLEDTPTNNFCTLNPITFGSGGGEPSATLSNGNLDFTESSSNNRTAVSTFGLKTGKWYFEFLSTNTGTFSIGMTDLENNQGSFYRNNGSYSSSFGGGGTSGYASWTTNDIVGVAIDFDSGKIWYAKNNTWQSGDPATGNSPTNTFTTGRTLHTEAFTDNSSGTKSGSFNYGQRPFTYTPPTGYKSMCSANLPDPTIKLPNKHFDTFLYTATGNAMSFPNELSFQPDWIWQKSRNSTVSSNVHYAIDAVRGGDKGLVINSTNAEYSGAAITFTSNGYDMGASSGGQGNASGNSYVSWNWNAGDTDGKTYTVKVHNFSGNNRYIFDDFQTEAVTLDLAEGGTYIFNMDDASNATHPFSIGTAANGTVYTSGITYFLDGVSKTYNEYTLGFSAASTRRLHITVPASAPVLYYWCSVHSGMGGQINTNSTLGSSNFDGSTQSTVKANPTAGFSIVTYTGQQNASDTIGHGLGVKPQVVISKSRNATYTYTQWYVHHHKLTTNYFVFLNTDGAQANGLGDYYIDGSFSSTVFAVGDDIYGPNVSNNNYVAYCFSEVEGYSKFGSYTGNGSSDGTFVFTGFRPAFVITKNASSAYDWMLFDVKRSPFNDINDYLFPNDSSAEGTGSSTINVDFLSNGFKWRGSSSGNNYINKSGDTFIYLAFAESPFKNSRAR